MMVAEVGSCRSTGVYKFCGCRRAEGRTIEQVPPVLVGTRKVKG